MGGRDKKLSWLWWSPEMRRGRLKGAAAIIAIYCLATELTFALREEHLASNFSNWAIGIGVGVAAIAGSMLVAAKLARERVWKLSSALLIGYFVGVLALVPLTVKLAFKALGALVRHS